MQNTRYTALQLRHGVVEAMPEASTLQKALDLLTLQAVTGCGYPVVVVDDNNKKLFVNTAEACANIAFAYPELDLDALASLHCGQTKLHEVYAYYDILDLNVVWNNRPQ